MSNKKQPTITQDEWYLELFKPRAAKPEDAFTVAEIAKKTGNPEGTMLARLSKLVANGTLEKGQCNINGRQCNWYRPIKK